MPRLVFSNRFEKRLRDFLKRHPELTAAVRERFLILEKNSKDQSLKSHKLSGKLKGLFAANITHEYRVIFYLEDDNIFLLAIGTHDEVY